MSSAEATPVSRAAGKDAVVQAWSRVRPGCVPSAVELLSWGRKTRVYRLGGALPGGESVIAKERRSEHVEAEAAVYWEVLGDASIRTVQLYGFHVDTPTSAFLFLEEARGESYSSADASHREALGAWLGQLHRACLGATIPRAALPDRGIGYYRHRLEEAKRLVSTAALGDEDGVMYKLAARVGHVESMWPTIERICRSAPKVVVHGDLKLANIRVAHEQGNTIPLIFDWEYAGWGEPTVDLAQRWPTGHVASPDLDAYLENVGYAWRTANRRTVELLAHAGGVFRALDGLLWSAWHLEAGSHRNGSAALAKYEHRLAELLEATP